MECLSIYNNYGEKTNEIAEREEAHKKGLCHRVFHLWIINHSNQVLIQQRSAIKDTGANLWYVSVGGHVESSESIEHAIIRETSEELGLDVALLTDNIKYLYSFQEEIIEKNRSTIDNEFYDVFVLQTDVSLDQIIMQKCEVQAVKYLDYDIFRKEIISERSSFVPHKSAYKLLITALDDYL